MMNSRDSFVHSESNFDAFSLFNVPCLFRSKEVDWDRSLPCYTTPSSFCLVFAYVVPREDFSKK